MGSSTNKKTVTLKIPGIKLVMIYQESSQIEKDLINRRKLSQGVNIKFLP
jgi:hypothetical protein